MSGRLKNKVHTDTPRPLSNRPVNVRWHPDERLQRWAPRSHRLPKFPMQSHLADWAESSPVHGGLKTSRNGNDGQKQLKTLPEVSGHAHTIPPTQSANMEGQEGIAPSGELSCDNLKTHDENGGELSRGSDSDEESSSSKRSRDDMEDGVEEDAPTSYHHLKRTRRREPTTNPDDCPSKRGVGVDNNNNSQGNSANKVTVQQGLTGPTMHADSGTVPISERGVNEAKMMASARGNLNVQYMLTKDNVGRGDTTPDKSMKFGKVVLAPRFGIGSGKDDGATDKAAVAPVKTSSVPVQSNGGRKDESGDKKFHSLKTTGIHRSLQKQLLEKRIASGKQPVAHPVVPEMDSTEESEEEKENWNKVVESLTAEVVGMEPVPSLNRLLQRSSSPPLPPPAPMHPWGLFPFGPMVSSFPYGPCHPYWLQQPQGPCFGPFPRMGQQVPSAVQFPPPNLDEMPPSLGGDHGSPTGDAGTAARNREHSRRVETECVTPVSGPRGYTPRKILLLQHEDGEVRSEQRSQRIESEALLSTPSWSQPPADRMQKLLQGGGGSLAGPPSQQFLNGQQNPMKQRALPEGNHIRFTSDEVEEGEITDQQASTPEDWTTSGEEEGMADQRPARKVYVPGKIKQMKEGKCDLSYKTPGPISDAKGCSFIQLMRREPSVSVYAPRDSTESSGEEPVNITKQTSDREQAEESSSDSEAFQTPGAWRRDPRVIGPAPASAPACLSTNRMPFRGPRPYSSCLESPLNSHGHIVNPTRAQLIARIQPRRRLTLQEEVMMEGIPKSFRRQFGLPESSRSSVDPSHQTESGVVYPWSNVEYIDTHCHIDFLYQRLGCNGTFEKFARMRGYPDNYGGCVAIFCTPDSFHPSNPVWQNLLKEDNIWAAFGCHPHHVKNYDGVVETNILRGMMHEKAVAFGEIGLDYSNRNTSDHVLQHMVFKRQLALAMQLQKPLVIHSREAESDTLDIMVNMVPKDYKIHRHCFTGPPEEAKAFMDAFPNSYIGLTNLVTFPSAIETHHTAQVLPLNRLLLETDAPYFLPKQCPKEIRWSHPAMAVFVAEKIARLRGITTDEVLRAVRRNTKQMYGI